MSRHTQTLPSRPRAPRMASNEFAFIDQTSNPTTVTAEQRAAIRSRVMRGVREWEAQAGIRRTGSRRPSPPTNAPSTSTSSQSQAPPEPRAQNENEVRELLSFCFEEFLPFVFPARGRRDTGNNKRQRSIIDSRTSRPATFFGVLTIAAAHLSIRDNLDIDLDPNMHDADDSALASTFSSMNLMKHYALSSITRLTNQTISSNQSCDEQIVEAVFLQIGAALSVGNMVEAKVHYGAMESSMREDPNFDHKPISNSPWIPVYDLAYAAALGQTRPLFDLPWDEDTVHEYLEDKVPSLPSGHKLSRLGLGFRDVVPGTSSELRVIITQARQIALLWETVEGLSSAEHELLYRKVLQLQYDIIMYLYEEGTRIRPIEKVICLAIHALTSTTMIRVLPPSGQGRQMTHFHNAAVQNLLATSPRESELKLLVWALTLFRQCSADEEKSEFFDHVLRRVIEGALRLSSGAELEGILCQFLYMPRTQEGVPLKVLKAALEG